jgi:hypothetical protein
MCALVHRKKNLRVKIILTRAKSARWFFYGCIFSAGTTQSKKKSPRSLRNAAKKSCLAKAEKILGFLGGGFGGRLGALGDARRLAGRRLPMQRASGSTARESGFRFAQRSRRGFFRPGRDCSFGILHSRADRRTAGAVAFVADNGLTGAFFG